MKFRIKKVVESIYCYPYEIINYLVQVKVVYLFFFKKWLTIKTFTMENDYELGDYDAEQEAEKFLKELEK